MVLPIPSKEQYHIISKLSKSNVIVTAVAGSGKTTLALHVCKNYENARVLIITYNSSLKETTREKLMKENLTKNVECYTYHGLMAKVCNGACYDDIMFMNLLNEVLPSIEGIFPYDIIIIDEMQDMRRPHYLFISRLLRRYNINSMRFLLVGDIGQKIYNFYAKDPADDRFLMKSDILFKEFTQDDFFRMKLTTSYRSTVNISRFVNYVTRKELLRDKIKAGNITSKNEPVEFIIDYPASNNIKNKIKSCIDYFGANNVMILAHSPKYKGLQNIVNFLSKHYNFFVNSKNGKNSEILMKNKVLIQTFCGCKGLERKCVIVFSVSYSEFLFGENYNQIYVALTRSSGGKLIIIQDSNIPLYSSFSSLIDMKMNLGDSILIQRNQDMNPREGKKERNKQTFNADRMCDFIDTGLLLDACKYIKYENLSPAVCSHDQETKIRFGGICEDVSFLIEKAIIMMLEKKHTNTIKQIELILNPITAHSETELHELYEKYGECVILKDKYKETFPPEKIKRIEYLLKSDNLSMAEYVELSNATFAYQNYHHILRQIRNYEWVDESLNDISNFYIINQNKTGKPRFREKCCYLSQNGKISLIGYADLIINDEELWLFIWADKFQIEHMIKCAIYVCMAGQSYGYLYNFKSLEYVKIEIKNKIEFLEFMIQTKLAVPTVLNDKDFFDSLQ